MGTKPIVALLSLLAGGCSSATPLGGETEECRFTYQGDSGRPPYECAIPMDAAETCREALECLCAEWEREGTAEDVERCVEAEATPRAMITLSDFCGPTTELTIVEALRRWAADRGAVVDGDPPCDDLRATLDLP